MAIYVADHFLTVYCWEKQNGFSRKNRGEKFDKSYVPLHGGSKFIILPTLSQTYMSYRRIRVYHLYPNKKS